MIAVDRKSNFQRGLPEYYGQTAFFFESCDVIIAHSKSCTYWELYYYQ
jgi:hypothetical protein